MTVAAGIDPVKRRLRWPAMESMTVESSLRDEEATAERLAARVRLALIAALTSVQAVLLLSGVVEVTGGLVGLGLGVVAAIYGAAVIVALRRGYRPAVSYVTLALDVALVTALTIASGLLAGQPAAATKAPYNLLLFLVIAMAGLRQAPDLPIVAGVLAVIGYLSVFLAAAVAAPQRIGICVDCDFNGPDVSPVRIATVAALLILAGGITSVTARRARELVRRTARASARRQSLLTAMERYFPEREALRMLESGQELTPGGERRRLAVMTTDIRGFTTVSEKLTAEQTFGLLNSYFEEMVRIIFEQDGTLISFVGDGIWAVFGGGEDDADRALRAALGMRARLAEMNRDGVFGSVGGLRIGMAIHHGDVLAGSVGSSQRLEYTVIGDTVNSTARLEELNKRLETDLLISEAAADRLSSRAGLIDRGELPLRGRGEPLRVYAVETVGGAASGVESNQH